MLNLAKSRVFILFFMGILLMTFNACQQDTEEILAASEDVTYTYDHSTTVLTWTAYKYTDKIGVSGTFDEFNINHINQANSIADLVQDLSFSVNPHSVNTNLPFRDQNIIDYFFTQLDIDGDITGSITNSTESKKSGSMMVDINMNGVNNAIYFNYTFSEIDNKLTIEGDIDVNDWNGENALSVMNEHCAELHTGADGINKLWPDVSIQIETTLIVEPN